MNISRIAVYKKVKKGQIKAKKAGRDYIIPSSAAEEFIVNDEEPAKYGEIHVFRPEDLKTGIEARLTKDTIWLNLNQMSVLFDRDKSVISRHIKNVFDEKELVRDSVVANFATTAADGKKYDTEYYSLDVIISVGYRVKSSAGVQFRIWATGVLKQHLVQGYTINEKRLKEASAMFAQLRTAVNLLSRSVQDETFKGLEAELISVINSFAGSLNILQGYDDMKLKAGGKKKQEYELTYEEALTQIEKAKKEYIKQKKASSLFGKGKGDKLKSLIGAVNQSFNGKDVYPTAEEKAAHLLYFAVKDHPFADGNKRIAAILFLYYLAKNNLLYKPDGSPSISNGALASLTLLTAISAPAEKDTIVKVILNVMRAG
ncbi:MAG: virulence RhuM family protein [Candidatus Goldbacteria bacterium]|nr:virulence RhuM family protein [Candidatus Goldiibacteriota bacterium]